VPIRFWSRVLKGRSYLKEKSIDGWILSKRLRNKVDVENMDWINLVQGEVRRDTFVSTVMKLGIP
jgi:hypothetical protein